MTVQMTMEEFKRFESALTFKNNVIEEAEKCFVLDSDGNEQINGFRAYELVARLRHSK